jgi:molybdopterin converting factor small subunit
VATLRLFAAAREAAGRGSDSFDDDTVAGLLESAGHRYGPDFVRVLSSCKVWCNGEEVDPSHRIGASDEVAVLPPVSGGF